MKRALMCSTIACLLVLGACGKDESNNPAGSNNTSGTNGNNTNGTTGTNSSVPTAGDCEWGEFLATCGGGSERDYSARAVGCREYYTPSPTEAVQQADLCADEIWDEMEKCSNSGLSGRRPTGCCYEVDSEKNLYSRHCIYDDPAALEATGAAAETACTDAGFCWIPFEMMQ